MMALYDWAVVSVAVAVGAASVHEPGSKPPGMSPSSKMEAVVNYLNRSWM